MLHAANLGDSGFMVLRGKRVLLRSRTQQHQFNFPYQARWHTRASLLCCDTLCMQCAVGKLLMLTARSHQPCSGLCSSGAAGGRRMTRPAART